MSSYEQESTFAWGEAMYEIEMRGLNIKIDHDSYPRWTCRLWRDMPGQHIDVSDHAYSPLGALENALVSLKKAEGN